MPRSQGGPGSGGAVVRPGGPSAKTFHRAGSPNHQSDSEENSMLEPAAPVNDVRSVLDRPFMRAIHHAAFDAGAMC